VTIAAEPLEHLILDMLFTAIENDDLGQRIGDRRSRGKDVSPDVAAIEDDLRGLAEDFGHGKISRAEWMAARGPLEDRLRAAHAAVERREADRVVEALDVDLRALWPTLEVDRQRAILAAVFEAILVHPAKRKGGPGIEVDRVEPRWRA
jgi:hypothetical protein